jgi:uncharacterized protein
MNQVFVDTSALIALGNKRDMLHQQAIEVRQELIANGSYFVTTNLVLAELCNAFSPPNLRGTAILQIDSIEHSSRWRVVEMDSYLWRESFALYRKMFDKSWGLVDCASMIVARRLEILTIFTADHHFTQAGFNILLK